MLEGGEGVGKSTQAGLLARRLDAVVTREPGGTALGERARALLLDPSVGDVEPRAELLLMVAARAQHVGEVILPALASGRDVVCDRFTGSTIAYQGYGRGLPLEEVEQACAIASGRLVPDLTVLVELDEQVAASRRSAVPDRIEAEDAEFHARVRAGFQMLAEQCGWAVVDGGGSPEKVAEDIAEVVEYRLAPATPDRSP
ncbi:MAG: thymidylate kinase [Acidimicrobiaceae bacterium]|nr:thymidylate kinase [Acidimicrobiaceae bacterium]